MSSATLASLCKERPFSYENSLCNNPRDDSFASYLAVVRDNLTPEFPITPTRLRPTPLHINFTRKRSDDDTEIDIFDADKYFNGSPNPDVPATPVENTTKPSTPSVTLTKSHSLTWTVSESSSGCSSQTTVNSRNVLLRNRRRRAVVGCGGGGSRVFHLGGLGFWCSSCFRKHAAANVNKANIESGSISSGGGKLVEQKQSISPSPVRWRIEMSSPANWPTSQRRLPPPPQKFLDDKGEDDRSESSSDLFEIESVGMSRTGGYEPSEASIAWSVVTARAANVSVPSDRSVEIGKGRRKSAGLLLAGCATHKAVEVSAAAAAAEVESSISPVVARYHVDLDAGGGSGRILTGRASGTSWHGGSGRIVT